MMPAFRQPRNAVGQSTGVEQSEQHALFALDIQLAQGRGEPSDAIGKLAVGQAPARVDIGGLVGATGGEIALQNVGSEIVLPWDCAHRYRCGRSCRARFRDCHC